jgi:hypothetical protein
MAVSRVAGALHTLGSSYGQSLERGRMNAALGMSFLYALYKERGRLHAALGMSCQYAYEMRVNTKREVVCMLRLACHVITPLK